MLFSIALTLKSSRLASWKLSHDIFIKLSTGFNTQKNTKLIQDIFLGLKGLTALVLLVDHPTSIKTEKPNLHFGSLCCTVTELEMKRASVHVERTHDRPAVSQPVRINPPSSLAAE